MPTVHLEPHPEMPFPAVHSVDLRVKRRHGQLELQATILGDIKAITVPTPAARQRVDGLWQHTCLEAFVKMDGGDAYHELNLAPSGEWQAYGFDRYREFREFAPAETPTIVSRATNGELQIEARIDLASLSSEYVDRTLRLALAMVVEHRDGSLGYWALRHPDGRADFHHADAFALTLGSD